MNKDLKIVVVYGGISTEREISLRSGQAVYEALKEYGFTDVTLFDLHHDNIGELLAMKPEIAYLALHGKGGEDGCIQGVLELAGIPYTGPGVGASAVGMDKIYTKNMLKAAGLPTSEYIAVHKSEMTVDEIAARIVEKIGLPAVLKAPCQGSSIGVEIVKEASALTKAIEDIFSYEDQLLAEKFVSGTEITVPIIGNEELQVLPEIEITSEREFFDYKAKYTQGLCHHIIPARISEADRTAAIEIAKQVYRKLNLCGVSRIDFIVGASGPIVLEVNTLPGMTAMSLVPDATRVAGIGFPELVAKIIDFGLHAKRG